MIVVGLLEVAVAVLGERRPLRPVTRCIPCPEQEHDQSPTVVFRAQYRACMRTDFALVNRVAKRQKVQQVHTGQFLSLIQPFSVCLLCYTSLFGLAYLLVREKILLQTLAKRGLKCRCMRCREVKGQEFKDAALVVRK